MNEFSIPEAGARRELLLKMASAFHEFCGFEACAVHEFWILAAGNAPGILCMNFVQLCMDFLGQNLLGK